jgi:uncharacterized protein
MDSVQIARRPGALAGARRHAPLILAGVVGTVIGTQFLAWVSTRVLLASLGSVILLLVVVALARPAWQLAPDWEWAVGPLVGLVAGILGGLTNVPGALIPLYYQALGLAKGDFVRAVALTLLVLKIAQLGAVWQVGLMEPRLLGLSVGATVIALATFRLGLWAQDRVPVAAFNRAVLLFLGAVSIVMLLRAAWS